MKLKPTEPLRGRIKHPITRRAAQRLRIALDAQIGTLRYAYAHSWRQRNNRLFAFTSLRGKAEFMAHYAALNATADAIAAPVDTHQGESP